MTTNAVWLVTRGMYSDYRVYSAHISEIGAKKEAEKLARHFKDTRWVEISGGGNSALTGALSELYGTMVYSDGSAVEDMWTNIQVEKYELLP